MVDKEVLNKRYRTWLIFSWICCIVAWMALVYFAFTLDNIVKDYAFLPLKWRQYAFYGLLGITIFMAFFTFLPKIKTLGKLITMMINLILSALLFFGSMYIPKTKDSFEKMFTDVPKEGELEVAFYILKEENSAVGFNKVRAEELNEDIKAYVDSRFIVQKDIDVENQEYALTVVKRELETDNLKEVVSDNLWQAIDNLYTGNGDVLVLNSSYLGIIKRVEGYQNFEDKVTKIYSVKKKIQLIDDQALEDITNRPFNFLIQGSDEWGDVISTNAKMDVNILVTINPSTKQILLTSMPRDSYIQNPALGYGYDKLTHMGFMGIDNCVNAISNWLGVNIDYYMIVNFSTFQDIVDAMGGIGIYNPYYFESLEIYSYEAPTYQGVFEEGCLYLDGMMALQYVRERHSLPDGDFGRNLHQEIVLKALLRKITTPKMIMQIDKLLSALKGKFITNMSTSAMYSLAQMQLDDMANWNIKNTAIIGPTGFEICASMDASTPLSIVYPSYESVEQAKDKINKVLSGEILEDEVIIDNSETTQQPINEGEAQPVYIDPEKEKGCPL